MKNNSFERIKKELRETIEKNACQKIGVGVSGGVDSMVMLDVLITVCNELSHSLYVLTIDHNMRTDGTSACDAAFVLEYCVKRGAKVLAGKCAEIDSDVKKDAINNKSSCSVVKVAPLAETTSADFVVKVAPPVKAQNDDLVLKNARPTETKCIECELENAHTFETKTALPENPVPAVTVKNIQSTLQSFSFYCQKLEFPQGLITKTARERGRGCEEAARFLRYRAFDSFIAQNGIDIFCTAHNKNDQLETLIQRFLQGSSPVASSGIQKTRGVYFRPFLTVSRDEILSYAEKNAIPYRKDPTNLVNDYYRNRIRNTLIPFLNEHFVGWQTGVLHGGEKAADFAESFNALFAPFEEITIGQNGATIEQSRFQVLAIGARITLICKALTALGVTNRVPYDTLKKAAGVQTDFYCDDFTLYRKDGFIEISRPRCKNNTAKTANANGFCLLLTSANASFTVGNFTVTASATGKNGGFGPFALPCVIRNRQSADKIKGANGSFKSLSRIFSDWKVPEAVRDTIPIVENAGVVRAILGSCCGFKDWIAADGNASCKSAVYVHIE